MNQEKLLQIIAGAGRAAKKTGELVKSSTVSFLEQNVLKGNYVSREEYYQLKKTLANIEKELEDLKKKISK